MGMSRQHEPVPVFLRFHIIRWLVVDKNPLRPIVKPLRQLRKGLPIHPVTSVRTPDQHKFLVYLANRILQNMNARRPYRFRQLRFVIIRLRAITALVMISIYIINAMPAGNLPQYRKGLPHLRKRGGLVHDVPAQNHDVRLFLSYGFHHFP